MLDRIWVWLGGVFLVSILPILYFSTNSAGEKAFTDLAIEYEICSDADSCTDTAKSIFAEFVIEGTKYSSMRQIQWCLGVDTWADVTVRRGGWLVGLMMDVGYVFCPNNNA